MLRMPGVLFLIGAVLAIAPSTYATTLFSASGIFNGGQILSGTITIDTVGGTVTALDLTVTSGAGFVGFNATINSSAPLGNTYQIGAPGSGPFPPFFTLYVPTANLVGYSGGDFCFSSPCSGTALPGGVGSLASDTNSTLILLTSGGLSVATPEPATLGSVGGSMLILGLLWRLRRNSH